MADDTQSQILLKLSAIDNLTPVMVKALQSMEQNSSKMAASLDHVSESTKHTQEHTEGLHGGLVSLEAGLEVAHMGLELVEKGFEILSEKIGEAIKVSLEAEKAQTRMTGALVSTGKYTAELNEHLNEYAENLQKTTGVSAETVKGILATGISMGLSTEKAQQLVSASQKLAAATGTDVQTAFEKLRGSLAGHARAIATSVAGVGDLSAAQLKSGAAIDLVNSQLTAQFQIYQGSFAAGLERAHVGVEELYKNFGNLITQNPAVKAALGQFNILLNELGEFVSHNKGEMKDWVSNGILLVVDSLEGMNLVFDAIYRGGVIAFNGVEGALQTLALGVVTLVDGPFALLYKALSYLPGEKGKEFQAAADAITDHMGEMADGVNKSSAAIDKALEGSTATSKKLEDGILKVREAITGAISSEANMKKSLEDTNESATEQAAALLKLQKTYSGFSYGTLAQRQELQLQVSDRDKDLKDFTAYLDDRQRLAISKAQEQQMAINAIASKAVQGAGGGEDKSAAAQVAIDAESKKQLGLDVLRKKGVLSESAYNEALMASDQKAHQAQLAQSLAFAQAKADALGDSPAGFAAKQQIAARQQELAISQARQRLTAVGATEVQQQAVQARMKQQFYAQQLQQERQFDQQEIQLATAHEKQQADLLGNSPAGQQKKLQLADVQFKMQLQQKKIHAMQDGLSQRQIDGMVQSETQTNLANMKLMKEKFIEEDMQQNEVLGNNWQVSLDKIALSQEKFGAVMGTLRGVQQTEEFKGTMGALNNLSSLRNSKSKGAFEVGKAAAIAQTGVSTGMSAMEAFSAMASIPFVGPALGVAAAAAAVAAGIVQIQNISSQNFNPGGQADQGMDSIPSALNGKSFILSQGERVVQPEANQKLTAFLDKQSTGGSAQGGGVMITLNYQGSMSQDDVSKMADMLVKEIRTRSDRGTPIMNTKGLVSS
jgi:hypothetical protein